MRDAFAATFQLELAHKPGILVTGDLGYGVFDELAKRHPGNFLNAGITEQSITSMCSGLADEGYIPFIYSIANFPTFRNLEQIRNDIAYPNKHVVVTSVGAGLSYGTLGFSHFGVEDIAIIRSLPNMRILSPSDPIRARLATSSSFEVASPTYLRLGKNGEENFGDIQQEKHLALRTIIDEGNRIAVISTGSIGARVEKIYRQQQGGFDHYSLEEFDSSNAELWATISNYSGILVVEEHSPLGGLFSHIAEGCITREIPAKLSTCAVDRSKLNLAGDHNYMLNQSGLSEDSITSALKRAQGL